MSVGDWVAVAVITALIVACLAYDAWAVIRTTPPTTQPRVRQEPYPTHEARHRRAETE